jgi:hypothetical protein
MSVSLRRGAFEVYVYDPSIKRKRYIGRYATEEEARQVHADQAALYGGGDATRTRRCPGCKKLFLPEDQWQKRCSLRCEANIKRRERRLRERRDNDHWTYTALNAEMEVIYVGVTSTGLRRHREHGREMEWWPEVAFMKIDHYETRAQALEAEAAGIRRHRPKYNTLGVENEAA